MDEQLRWLDGLAQADLVRAQKASPAELKAEARERIRRRHPQLNALMREAVPGGPSSDAHAHAALPRPARRWRMSRSSSRTSRSSSRGTPFTLMALAAQLEAARSLARASPMRARTVRVFEPFSASHGFAENGPPRSRLSRSVTS